MLPCPTPCCGCQAQPSPQCYASCSSQGKNTQQEHGAMASTPCMQEHIPVTNLHSNTDTSLASPCPQTKASPGEIYLLLPPAVLTPPHAHCRQDGRWAPHCRHRQWGHAGTCKQRSRTHTSELEVPAGARCSPGSRLPRKVLAPSPLAGACSYFRKPPGKERVQQSCQPRCSAPIHWEKGKSQAQPGLTCPAQCSSLAWEPDLRAPKHLAAWQSCHKHEAIVALQ